MDWKDESAIACLTRAILIAKFGLKSYELPKNYLVPRVPQRLAYLSWIDQMLKLSEIEKEVKGLDIGIGANCIYSILAVLQYKWIMIGSDISEDSIKWAKE